MLTLRQTREADYHRQHARRQEGLVNQPVAADVVSARVRRPWNAYWCLYDRLLAAQLEGKRVLVPGCGFGEDAIRLSSLGAEVFGFDISAEAVDIARQRAARSGHSHVELSVMPAEAMTYPESFFDGVVFVDILHHVDIPDTMREIVRVLRPGGLIIGNELYTHSSLQRVRESRLVEHVAYPLMQHWIYGTRDPYITVDEHKIDEREFAIVATAMSECRTDYFGMFEGRLFPSRLTWAARIDRTLMRVSKPLAPRLGSRVVFSGTVKG